MPKNWGEKIFTAIERELHSRFLLLHKNDVKNRSSVGQSQELVYSSNIYKAPAP